ncbi:hypothetical protein H4CHR_02898 [Variovorax sp. PBS-H4]|uniref:hypothetical protein n=1 Tax=Variovorax sp. PBS-H4 TaxID=434008 RepID=UPI0013180E42|nr:hypothetical protein [Variovorax sp. PBS-H4]VTU31883.1 hypothetical protein H4CHR_02898 [Variovorax sp. PBS-H4]
MSNQLASAPSYPAFVRSLFQVSGDPSKDFAHAIMGVVTETYEYLRAKDRTHAIEELGDADFYVQATKQVLEDFIVDRLPMSDIEAQVEDELRVFISLTPDGRKEMLDSTLNELLDHAKRWVGYGTAPLSIPAAFSLVLVAQIAGREQGLVPLSDASVSRIRSVNMAKLAKRFPAGKYEQFRALQRDLAGERETLEAAVLG